MSNEGSYNVWLPATFWHDHADRELPAGVLIKERGRRVQVNCTRAELDEIRSDAAYYSDKSGGPDWEEGGPIRRSAAATVRAIDRVLSSDCGAPR